MLQIPACIDQCVETSCDFPESLRKDFGLEKFKIILQATDFPALIRSDQVSLIEDILMAASHGDENLLDCYSNRFFLCMWNMWFKREFNLYPQCCVFLNCLE